VNFCVECGSKLEIICPECGYSNSLSHKFCGGCGHKLTLPAEAIPKGLSFDQKLTKIQRYLPKGLTDKILSQKDRIEGEHKHVTVMFCDMEGFTKLSEMIGPEEAYTIMDQVYEILIHKVHEYEGTVNEFTGDGIMALFGAPIALEDAPQRAIRSAYAIHREMTKFSDKIKQEKKNILALKMRIGIHTGPVVVGTLGNDLRVEFKAVGDTVNLASRMEGLAEPSSTYVTEDTFRLTEGLFRFEVLGEHAVKGRADPVKAYRVIAPSTSRTRFDVSAERGLTPFVGRERELELLLDSFERSKTGRGQAFSIISEAGVGKSRLLYEFRKAVANEDVAFMEGKCLSYSRGVAYHPVIDILKSNFDIKGSDGNLEITEKLKQGLEILEADETSILPFLLELLSVKDSGADTKTLSPEARKHRIIESLNQIIIKVSQIRPLIMAIEDLHWIDKSSEDSLKALLDSISGESVFLIFTYRPEYVHTWGAKSYHSQVNLNPLSNREGLAMVLHLFGKKDIEKELEELILEKTEGVPFFIEEFIRSLMDLKIIESDDSKYRLVKGTREVTVPSTIQDVIMARVDSLPEGSKEVLQTGSVIEREFSYDLIKRLTALPEQELLTHLSVLRDSELLYERGLYPQSYHIFKHALTQEVVYSSILSKRRKRLHQQVGSAIEQIHKENLSEHYGVLSEHFIRGENFEKGAQYSRFAGRRAEQNASFVDAVAYSEKGINCLEKMPQTDEVKKKIIDARTTLGLYLTQITIIPKAKEAVAPILDLTIESGYKNRLSQIYTILGTYRFVVEEDFANAFKYLEEALQISEETKNTISFFFASYWLGVARWQNCEFGKSAEHWGKTLDINMAANNPWGIVTMKANLALLLQYQGKIHLHYECSKEVIQLAEESGDNHSKAWAYPCMGFSCYYKGFFKEAIEYLQKGFDFCEKINLSWVDFEAQLHLGLSNMEIGDYERSKYHFNRAIQIAEQGKYGRSRVNAFKIWLAAAKVMSKEKNIELDTLYKQASGNQIKLLDSSIARNIATILLNIDDRHRSEAEDWIERAIEADKKNGMTWFLARDYALYAELFKRKNNKSKAKENLTQAIKILRECGADGWVENYEKELIEL
jgi:class 3 adenylate cyclase/tetratricopeptide (TPR) repeat protein